MPKIWPCHLTVSKVTEAKLSCHQFFVPLMTSFLSRSVWLNSFLNIWFFVAFVNGISFYFCHVHFWYIKAIILYVGFYHCVSINIYLLKMLFFQNDWIVIIQHLSGYMSLSFNKLHLLIPGFLRETTNWFFHLPFCTALGNQNYFFSDRWTYINIGMIKTHF